MEQFEITQEMQASKGIRFANFIIDYLAIVALLIVILIGLGVLLTVSTGTNSFDFPQQSPILFNVAVFVFFFLYYFIWEALAGRTLGKLITGTIVVHESGDKPTTRTIFVRSICRLIPFEPLSCLGETGWHDGISGTRVVKKHIYIMRKNQLVEMDEIGRNNELI